MAEASVAYFYDTLVASFQRQLKRPIHRHGASQLTVSLDGKPHRVGPSEARMRPGLVHFAGTHAQHAFDGGDGVQLLLWLAPESKVSRVLTREYVRDDGCGVLPPALLDTLPLDTLREAERERWPAERLRPLVEQLLETLTATTTHAAPMHPAVRRAVRIIRALPIKKISADVLAAEVGVSKGRMLHLLKDYLGTPLRPYLAWLRCIDAVALMSQGQDATQAALCAGFSDGAHFNRVLNQVFALSPSAVSGRADVRVCLTDPDDL